MLQGSVLSPYSSFCSMGLLLTSFWNFGYAEDLAIAVHLDLSAAEDITVPGIYFQELQPSMSKIDLADPRIFAVYHRLMVFTLAKTVNIFQVDKHE